MGQCQFMPSTYVGYAVDGDGDGRRDIWGSRADVFASAANYLANAGWSPGLRWGRPVSAPEGLHRARGGLDHRAALARWQAEGVRLPDGGELPAAAVEASLLTMDEAGPSYLVYPNFRTIMVWNRSTYFALSVGLLSDLIETG
jgi:membrane-bound lytic murein transglycosylase B